MFALWPQVVSRKVERAEPAFVPSHSPAERQCGLLGSHSGPWSSSLSVPHSRSHAILVNGKYFKIGSFLEMFSFTRVALEL